MDVAPIEIRPHVCAALAADPTGEALLDIGQSGIIGPAIAADRDGVATSVVGANNQQPTHAEARLYRVMSHAQSYRQAISRLRKKKPYLSNTAFAAAERKYDR